MRKKILGLKINPDSIGWVIISEHVSDFPQFERKQEVKREIKDDIYIVDHDGADVITFKIFRFENEALREKFKENAIAQYPSIIGADSKPETGLFYTIISDIQYLESEANNYMKRAIYSMDYLIEILN